MTEFREGDLVRAIPRLRMAYERSRPVALSGTEWHWQTGLVVEIEPQPGRCPAVITVSYPSILVRRSAVLFERMQDD